MMIIIASNLFWILVGVLFSGFVFKFAEGDNMVLLIGSIVSAVLHILSTSMRVLLHLNDRGETAFAAGLSTSLCSYMLVGNGNVLFQERPDLHFFSLFLTFYIALVILLCMVRLGQALIGPATAQH